MLELGDKLSRVGLGGLVGKAENIATQPSLAGAWAELGNSSDKYRRFYDRLFTLRYDPIGNSPRWPIKDSLKVPLTWNKFYRGIKLL